MNLMMLQKILNYWLLRVKVFLLTKMLCLINKKRFRIHLSIIIYVHLCIGLLNGVNFSALFNKIIGKKKMKTLDFEKIKMKTLKNKTATILIAAFLMFSMVASMALTNAQVTPAQGTSIPSYAHLNVGPNPAGVGQTVTLNMFLLIPTLTSEPATNITIVETTPSGTTSTLGPFKSDATGGTYTTIIPDTVGNYTFQFFYGGQYMTDDVYNLPSQSDIVTLIVQQEPIARSSYPITPHPTSWWQTPVTAENVQEWYKISGPWLGYGSVTFAATGGYNNTGNV